MNHPMTTFEVGFEIAPGIFSVNMICARVPAENEEAAVRECAESRAKHYNERVAYIRPLTECEVQERQRKGMPWYGVGDEIERRYGA